jgi:hypothetical protein
MLVLGVVIVVGILAVYAVLSSVLSTPTSSTPTTNGPRTWSEGKLFVTTGILELGYGANQLYFLNTSLRSLTQSQVVGISATVNYSSSISESSSRFFVGHSQSSSAQVTSSHPLGYNVTASIGTVALSPPNPLQLGQTLPETINVTFQNGTSVALHVSAQVYSRT